MFSKALFKQSCKANGLMWGIITFAVCFMLACVMLISGTGNISGVKDSVEDTIIVETIDSELEKNAINYYDVATTAEEKFDEYFVSEFKASFLAEFKKSGNAVEAYKTTAQTNISTVYQAAIADLNSYILEVAKARGFEENSSAHQELLGVALFTINPNGQANDQFEAFEPGSKTDAYDVTSLVQNINVSDLTAWALGNEGTNINEYLVSDTRNEYRNDRGAYSVPILIGGNMTKPEVKSSMLENLKEYGVTEEKYNTFDYSYTRVKHLSKTALVSYQARLEYELSLLDKTSDNYSELVLSKKKELNQDIAGSLLDLLPTDVSDAIKEIGQMDLYSLIVGSIFFKIAGLLLPIIYMIMVSNNLIVGQVDSGSMAYVLSTSTKRDQVTFTQACYLILSLFLMFVCTTITSIVCLGIVNISSTNLTVGKLILINLGAFLVLFAMSGINFLTSCIFDRSKKSMAIGGGLSMFFLVATMLGLFGSKVIPSVVRIKALNNFNYVTIISFFDAVSIIEGTNAFIWKFVILLIIGIVGYIIGALRFKKKDLPL